MKQHYTSPLPVKPEDLRSIPMLAELPDAEIERLAGQMVRQTYDSGQIIFLEGDRAIGLWFVLEGHIRIVRQSLAGRVQALCLMNRGSCFGTCPLFSGDSNPATAEAADRVTLVVLPQERMQHYMKEEPRLAGVLFRIYSRRLLHLAKLTERLGAWTASDRINDCLLAYADTTNPPIVSLTHERLSVLAGTVREVVTRHLTALERDGIVRVEPERITLLRAEQLAQVCEGQRFGRARGM